MQGKIIKSVSGFYDVHTEKDLYRCKAKGVFRSLKVKPLVGDDVEIDITDEGSEPKEGNITRILPRTNTLLRPNVANIDQALLVFSIKHPIPSFNMLDRFLILMQETNLPAILCFSKADLAAPEEIEALMDIYGRCGAEIRVISEKDAASVDAVRSLLLNKTTVFTGPSGVGKSSLINLLCPDAQMETGEISRKIDRGKNTTRHVELFVADCGENDRGSFVMDTPGFTSLFLEQTEAEDLKLYYPEFDAYMGKCRFNGCLHAEEPGCAVKEAVRSGEVSRIRYENYRELFEELKSRKPVYKKKNH